jgi:hypothetical protein
VGQRGERGAFQTVGGGGRRGDFDRRIVGLARRGEGGGRDGGGRGGLQGRQGEQEGEGGGGWVGGQPFCAGAGGEAVQNRFLEKHVLLFGRILCRYKSTGCVRVLPVSKYMKRGVM